MIMNFTLLLAIFLILGANTKAINRLDTIENDRISEGDQLISTLGMFKLTLQNSCLFKIQQFDRNQSKYIEVGTYKLPFNEPQNSEESCDLTISLADKSISSDANKFTLHQNDEPYDRFSFFIDDFGRITLLSFKGQGSQTQVKSEILQDLPNQDKYIKQSLTPGMNIENQNKWKFIQSNNQLFISGQNQTQSFSLNGINSNYLGIYDGDGQPLRYSSLPGITFQPKAQSLSTCDAAKFLGPFVYVIDPHYPIVRVFDKNKYQVVQFALDPSPNPKNFCPAFTFQHEGQCVTKCPLPFYHQLRGDRGSCVLACEANSIVDDQAMSCSSENFQPADNFNKNIIFSRLCPENSEPYSYGCICPNETFYNEVSNRCVTKELCQDGTLGVSGICAKCDDKCQECEIDPKRREYLRCVEGACLASYIQNDGLCQKPKCRIQNCVKCDTGSCQSCAAFYYLLDGVCRLKCEPPQLSFIGNDGKGFCELAPDRNPDNFVTAVYEDKPFAYIQSCPQDQLRYLEFCIKTCPESTIQQNDRCVCKDENHRLLGDQCQEVKEPPSGMYYDTDQLVYLNCPIGCLACEKMDCLDCAPGYVKIISSTGSVCRKNSPLIICDSQFYEYDPQKMACSVKPEFIPEQKQCDPGIANCELCSEANTCVHCKNGYFIFENECVDACPEDHYVYRGSCLKIKQNCQNNQMQLIPTEGTLNSEIASESQIFAHYTQNGEEVSVDPLGSIFIMRQELSLPPSDTSLQTTVNEGQLKCNKCKDRFRLFNNKCVPCGPNQVSTFSECKPCLAATPFIVGNECREHNCTVREIFTDQKCTECQAGTISANNRCITCRPGSIQIGNKCIACKRNEISQNNTCVQCPQSEFKLRNKCMKCPNRTIMVNGRCRACPQGTISQNNQCKQCGEFEVRQNNTCTKCSNNTIKVNNACQKCPDGKFASNNQCLDQQCGSRQVVINGNCQACSEGSIAVDGQCQECVNNQTQVNNECVCKRISTTSNKCLKCPQGFVLFDNETCAPSCPSSTIPERRVDYIVCVPRDVSTVGSALLVDSAVFSLDGEGKTNIFFFIVNTLVSSNSSKINFTFTPVANGSRLLQSGTPSSSNFQDNSYLGFAQNGLQQGFVDFTDQLTGLTSIDGEYLGNGKYGAKLGQSHSNNSQDYLAIIGKILSLVIMLIHVIYIGNNLLYKVDNTLIFAQTIYFFSFVKLLVGVPLAQFFNGFRWIHWKFYSNYFRETIPDGYIEGFAEKYQVPNPFRLLTIDANFIRNAGYTFSLLLTFLVIFGVIVLVLLILNKSGKYEVWYGKIAKDALIAGIEFISMAVMYWSVAHLLYNNEVFSSSYFTDHGKPEIYKRQDLESHDSFRRSCSIAATIFIILITLYTFVRLCFNKIGGLYMLKRVVFAIILAGSVDEHFYDPNTSLVYSSMQSLLAAALIAELVFVLLRFAIERPRTCGLIAMVVFEGIVMMIGYLLMYLWEDTGVVSVYLSIVLLILIILLIEDLIDVYNDARDEFYDEDVGIVPGVMQKIPDTERNA